MHRKILTVSRSIVASLLLVTFPSAAQNFQIRTRVDLVVVPVIVKSAEDKLVTDLKKEDFIVLEDGQKQTITNFTIDPVPLSAAVVVDTGLSAGSLEKVQQTFPALAGAFSQFDEVAVYRFSKDVVKLSDFSNDFDKIHTAIATIQEIQPDSPT